MTEDTPVTGSHQQLPPKSLAPDQTLPMQLNAGHGKPDPLADATLAANLNVPAADAKTVIAKPGPPAADLADTAPTARLGDSA
nr:hypothetical protein [Planctomycetota bacterium]